MQFYKYRIKRQNSNTTCHSVVILTRANSFSLITNTQRECHLFGQCMYPFRALNVDHNRQRPPASRLPLHKMDVVWLVSRVIVVVISGTDRSRNIALALTHSKELARPKCELCLY